VPVVNLLAHRHGERDAEAADEIFLVVAVENEVVDEPDVLDARIEVEPYIERQPFARPGIGFVDAFNLHCGANRAALFRRDLLDIAGESRAAFQHADQTRRPTDRTAIHRDGIDECGALLWNSRLNPAGIDIDGSGRFGELDRRSRQYGSAGRKPERGRRMRNRGETGPLDGAVGPISQRPLLQRKRGAARSQAECL
jgi:hypothetical protein